MRIESHFFHQQDFLIGFNHIQSLLSEVKDPFPDGYPSVELEECRATVSTSRTGVAARAVNTLHLSTTPRGAEGIGARLGQHLRCIDTCLGLFKDGIFHSM